MFTSTVTRCLEILLNVDGKIGQILSNTRWGRKAREMVVCPKFPSCEYVYPKMASVKARNGEVQQLTPSSQLLTTSS